MSSRSSNDPFMLPLSFLNLQGVPSEVVLSAAVS